MYVCITCGTASLPSYVVNSCSVSSFKTNIDKCWRNQDVYLMTINVILPEVETVVTVTSSLYSTVQCFSNYEEEDIEAKAYVFYSDTIRYD